VTSDDDGPSSNPAKYRYPHRMSRRLALLCVFSLFVGLLPATASGAWTYDMIFPLIPDPGYSDNFGDARSGGRTHAGIDIMAPKMTPIVAVADGTVGWMQDELGGNCCAMEIQHDDGYESWYIHMNNDTPGTDDGIYWGFAPGISQGVRVFAGQLIGWVGDSGNAENSGSHLHFELHDPEGTVLNPFTRLNAATRTGIPLDGNYEGPFWDDEGNIHEANIIRLAELGITSGCGVAQYCPFVNVSRGQIATFIDRTVNLPGSGTNWFIDDNGSPHEGAINSMADTGITLGCGGNRYCPNDSVSRQHMAVFLARAFDLPPSGDNPFGDISGNPYAWAIRALADAGITSGCGNGNFCPAKPVTRAQMATFLINAIDWGAANS
jgi:hypothetical protein